MSEQKIRQIEVAQVDPNPNQPRSEFPEEHIMALAASIRERGLMQPVVVRPKVKVVGEKSRYELIAGECRWRAHKHLGWEYIRAIVECGVDDKELQLRAIVENMQRRDIKPMEEARAFQRALDLGLTETELAKSIGMSSQPWRVPYRLRLLRLDPAYQKLLEAGQITLNAAQEIAKLEPAGQTRVIKQLANGTLKGDAAVTAAVNAILEDLSQEDIFGDGGKIVGAKDVDTVNRMEARIEQVAKMVASGWHNNESVVAQKVSPDRAALMADKIAEIRKALGVMEKDLRTVAAQASLVLDTAA